MWSAKIDHTSYGEVPRRRSRSTNRCGGDESGGGGGGGIDSEVI